MHPVYSLVTFGTHARIVHKFYLKLFYSSSDFLLFLPKFTSSHHLIHLFWCFIRIGLTIWSCLASNSKCHSLHYLTSGIMATASGFNVILANIFCLSLYTSDWDQWFFFPSSYVSKWWRDWQIKQQTSLGLYTMLFSIVQKRNILLVPLLDILLKETWKRMKSE